MLHRRTYNVVKLEKPEVDRYENKTYNYILSQTKDGETRILEKYHWNMAETEEEAKARAEELNKKFYLCDFDNQEIKDWFEGIDFTPLFNKVEEITELKLTFDVSLDELDKRHSSYEYFTIRNKENIVDFIPMLRAAWKEMYVKTFSRSIGVNEDGELYLWGDLNYIYNHQDGGHNGATILHFNYTTKDGWTITSEEERRIENEEASKRGYYE